MIKLEELTPSIYYKESRDFQLIGRLFDLVLNFGKTNADTIYYLPQGLNADEQFVTLLAMTLGFKPKHNYNSTQLKAICNALPIILKNKGSLAAIIIAANTLLRAEGITDTLDYEYDATEANLTVYLPFQLSDTILLEDLLDYITPAGLNITFTKEVRIETTGLTELTIKNKVKLYDVYGNELSKLTRDFTDKAKLDKTDNVIAHATVINPKI